MFWHLIERVLLKLQLLVDLLLAYSHTRFTTMCTTTVQLQQQCPISDRQILKAEILLSVPEMQKQLT